MKVYQVDPLQDPRWPLLVESHPKASVFHTVPWLRALRLTYEYEPMVFTTSAPSVQLNEGLVFCHIKSWLTGSRLVSLPFSDHCELLCDSAEDGEVLLSYLYSALQHQKWKYLELRPIDAAFCQACAGTTFLPVSKYYLHILDLSQDFDVLFRSLDYDSVQRRIRRAERAGLIEKCGRSDELLKDFYNLFVFTRSRQHVPPIPFTWFQNLIACLGSQLEIRVAYKNQTAIAAILTLHFKDSVYYKYGCSNERFHNFGAIPWLLWRAIEAAKSNGACKFDMGRTEEENRGLLTFKNHWVPNPRELIYWKYPSVSQLGSLRGWKLNVAKHIFSWMPEELMTLIGKTIYRHIG